MKIIVAGGRDFDNQEYMAKCLNEVYESGVVKTTPELVCGMALGADSMAKVMFENEGLVVHKRPSDWDDMSLPCKRKINKYGKEYNALAGMKRNHAMGDESELLIAFHDSTSTGTADMIKYMKSLGKPVYVFYY
jgi:hypothetical protein